jgi:hypothetical protein
VVISPTVLGNGIFAFVLRLLYESFPKGKLLSPEQFVNELKSLYVRGWFSLQRDVRSDIGESLAIGMGLVGFSVIAFVFSLVYFGLGLLAFPNVWPHLIRGFAVLIAARVAHVIGRGQLLANMDMIRTLLESPPPLKGSP